MTSHPNIYKRWFAIIALLLAVQTISAQNIRKRYIGVGYSDFHLTDASRYDHFNQLYLDYENRYSTKYFYNLSIAYEVIRQNPNSSIYNYVRGLSIENSFNIFVFNDISLGIGLALTMKDLSCKGDLCNDPYWMRLFDGSDAFGIIVPFFETSYYFPEYKGFRMSVGGRFSTGSMFSVEHFNYGFTTKLMYRINEE